MQASQYHQCSLQCKYHQYCHMISVQLAFNTHILHVLNDKDPWDRIFCGCQKNTISSEKWEPKQALLVRDELCSLQKMKRKTNPQNSKYFADPRTGWAGEGCEWEGDGGRGLWWVNRNLISRRIHWKKNNNKFRSTSCTSKWATSPAHKLVLTTFKATD